MKIKSPTKTPITPKKVPFTPKIVTNIDQYTGSQFYDQEIQINSVTPVNKIIKFESSNMHRGLETPDILKS